MLRFSCADARQGMQRNHVGVSKRETGKGRAMVTDAAAATLLGVQRQQQQRASRRSRGARQNPCRRTPAHLGSTAPSPTNATRPSPGSWSLSACVSSTHSTCACGRQGERQGECFSWCPVELQQQCQAVGSTPLGGVFARRVAQVLWQGNPDHTASRRTPPEPGSLACSEARSSWG